MRVSYINRLKRVCLQMQCNIYECLLATWLKQKKRLLRVRLGRLIKRQKFFYMNDFEKNIIYETETVESKSINHKQRNCRFFLYLYFWFLKSG